MWQIEQQLAIWKSRRLSARVDLIRPAIGLHHVRFDSVAWPDARLHQVSLPGAGADALEFIDDAYVRDSDLIVTYRESAVTVLRTQLQWRVREFPDNAAILVELTASVQTPGRDCDPRIRLSTTVSDLRWQQVGAETDCVWDLAAGEEYERVAIPVSPPGIVLLNSADKTGLRIGQAIPASDLVEARLERNQTPEGSTLAVTYFANRLEKGVLRRVRLQAYLMPEMRDVGAFAIFAAQSLHQSPPLVA